MNAPDRAATLALGAYYDEPLGQRAHVTFRWRTCPFQALASFVPPSGRVLDVGCGHGLFALYLALAAPNRAVTGVDVDEDKLAVARRAAYRAGADLAFDTNPSSGLVDGPWDAVTIVDVLYLLGRAPARELLHGVAESLAPGGSVIVKEISMEPRWKYAIAMAQEQLATRMLRITEGAGVHFLPPEEIAAELRGSGLRVHTRRLDRGRLHPHHVIVGTAMGSSHC